MNRAFIRPAMCLAVIAFLIPVANISARDSSADFHPQSHNTSAVDAKGIRHNGSSYKGTPPWMLDRLSGIAPYYPIEERRQRHQGRAIVQMMIDLNTGRVVRAGVIKSAGFRSLDDSAVAAFR